MPLLLTNYCLVFEAQQFLLCGYSVYCLWFPHTLQGQDQKQLEVAPQVVEKDLGRQGCGAAGFWG